MAYNTSYTINWPGDEPSQQELQEFLAGLPYFDNFMPVVEDVMGGAETTWYEWQGDMKKVADHWPETTFTVHGNGDDSDDIWVAFFRRKRFYRTYMEAPKADEEYLAGRTQAPNGSSPNRVEFE